MQAKRLIMAILTAWVMVRVTAYSPSECPNKHTASGTVPKQGRTIAASRHLPMGARVYVPSRGWHYVEDRTSRRYDRRKMPTVDIYMNSREEALKWGSRRIRVYVAPGKKVE